MNNRVTVIREGELGSRPNWDEYFMNLAIGVSSRASCYKVHAGSILVRNKRIVGTGYNGAPAGAESCLEKKRCHKEIETGNSYEKTMNMGLCRGVHGEMNALHHLTQQSKMSELSLYTTIFPCNSCAKNIYGIEKLVFKSAYDSREFDSALDLFLEGGTDVYQLDMSPMRKIDIDINHSNVVHGIWSPKHMEQIVEMRKMLKKLRGEYEI